MDRKIQENIALFRFRVISSLLNPDQYSSSISSQIVELSNHSFLDHKGESVKVSASTIERWFYTYKKMGFDGLKPRTRSDLGFYRKVDDDIFERIKYYHETYPRIPSTLIYEKLISDGIIHRKAVSLSTVTRVVNNIKISKKTKVSKEMRRYEREHINEVWCGDTSYGPYATIDGKKVRTYIIAFIDDASRMITSCDLVLNDNFANMMGVLKKGIVKYGKPKVLNFDNGSSFKNKQMELLSARIGTSVNYCAPYTPQSKAKIERWFRTLKDGWMCNFNRDSREDFLTLRESLLEFVDEYNNKLHKSLGTTPNDRFYKESNLIVRLSDELIDNAFLLEIQRKVSIDNVLVIEGKEYEVDYRYAKKRITLRYSKDLKDVYVVDEVTGSLEKIKLLNKIDNSDMRRNKIKFSEEL